MGAVLTHPAQSMAECDAQEAKADLSLPEEWETRLCCLLENNDNPLRSCEAGKHYDASHGSKHHEPKLQTICHCATISWANSTFSGSMPISSCSC